MQDICWIFKNKRSKGANGARNTGILKSKGKYIAFLDDDDEWLPNYLKDKVEKLKDSDRNVGGSLCNYYIQKNNKWKKYNINADEKIFSDFIIGRISIGASSNIFLKRQIIDDVGLWDEDLLRKQDLEFMIRVLDKYKVEIDNSYNIKVYGHNMPNPEKGFKQSEIFIKKIEKFIPKLNKDIIDQFYSNHYRRQANYLVQLKKYNKAINYWSKSLKYKPFSFKKDYRIVESLIKNVFR